MEGQGQTGAAPAAWHPDPYGGACHRWWDGTSWTEEVGPGEPQFGLAPMRDAAMQAEDAAYRMLLRSKKIADAVAEGEPDVAEAFAAFSTAFNSRFASSRPTTPDEDPSPPA